MGSGSVVDSVNGLVDGWDVGGSPGGFIEEGTVESVRADLEGGREVIEDVSRRRGNYLCRSKEGAVEVLTDTSLARVPVDACGGISRLRVREYGEGEGVEDGVGLGEAGCYHVCADEVVGLRLVGVYDDGVALRDVDRYAVGLNGLNQCGVCLNDGYGVVVH